MSFDHIWKTSFVINTHCCQTWREVGSLEARCLGSRTSLTLNGFWFGRREIFIIVRVRTLLFRFQIEIAIIFMPSNGFVFVKLKPSRSPNNAIIIFNSLRQRRIRASRTVRRPRIGLNGAPRDARALSANRRARRKNSPVYQPDLCPVYWCKVSIKSKLNILMRRLTTTGRTGCHS